MMFNEPYQKIEIHTGPGLRLAGLDSSKLQWSDSSRNEYFTIRNRKPLALSFAAGNSKINYKLRSRLSREYIFLNMLSPEGLGYFIDLFSRKRYAYPGENYFYYNAEANKVEHYTLKPFEPRTLRLGVGYSFMNIYTYGDSNSNADGPSPFGMNIIGERFYSKKRSFRFELGMSRGGALKNYGKRFGLPQPIDSIRREAIETFWIMATQKRHFDRWSIGAGLSASVNNQFWRTEYYGIDTTFYPHGSNQVDTILYGSLKHSLSGRSRQIKAGLNLNVEYKFSDRVTTGCNWQLYFMNLTNPRLYPSRLVNLYISFSFATISNKKKNTTHANH